MNKLDTTIANAIHILSATGNRSGYARDVISGRQRWSLADLKGKAKQYSLSYTLQRNKAASALRRAGGIIVPINHGRCVTGVYIGMDDYGNAIYATLKGVAVTKRKLAKLMK